MNGLVVFGGLLLASSPAAGPDAAPDRGIHEPPIEVRAPALPDPLGAFPLGGTRIERDRIARRPGGSVQDLLRPVAGLRIASYGASWSGASVSLRGSTGDQVLVLVDGRRRNPAQGGGADLAALALDAVESVDVHRGGASAFWGTDAIGGAIAVRTRAPENDAWSLRAASGSHGQRSLEGAVSVAGSGTWAARAGGRRLEADGDYAYVDDARGTERTIENGDMARSAAELRVDGRAGPAELRLDADWSGAERGVPGSEEFPTPGARRHEDRAGAGIRAELAGSAWEPVVDLTASRRVSRYTDAQGAFGAVDERHESVRLEAETGIRRRTGRTVWRAAVGALRDELTSTTDGAPTRESVDARVHVTHDRAVGERTLRWTGAVRVDAARGFAPFVSPRIGVAADLLPRGLTARASAGGSYRAPSFDELFWAPRASAAGNPDLRPERGADVEGGLEWGAAGGRVRIAVDVFTRTVDDLIQWVPGASGVWRPHNVGRVRIAGVESEGRLPLPSVGGFALELSASATYLDARDRTGEPNADGLLLVYRPRWSGSVGLLAGHPRWGEIETVWQGAGAVPVTRANTKWLGGAIVGDAHARLPLSGAMRLDIALTNLTDARVRDFRDYPLPGRSWRAGITWHGGGR